MQVRARLDPQTKLGLRLTLIVVAVVLVAIPFGLLLLEVVLRGPLTSFDQRVADAQHADALVDPDRVAAARLVTNLGSTVVLTVIVIVVVVHLAVFHRWRRQALYLTTTAILGVVTNNVVKVLVGRSRPHFSDAVAHAFGKSFPSGHAMNSTVVYGAILLIAWGPLRSTGRRVVASTACVALVGVIAASRVVLGVHYVTDVVAGALLGAAFVLASGGAFVAWQREGGHLPVGVEQAPTLPEVADDDVARR